MAILILLQQTTFCFTDYIQGYIFTNLFLLIIIVAYHLYTVVPRLVKFVDQLTNWYVRMNRKRLKVS